MENPTTRIRLDLAYDGTNFHGWAKQGDSSLRTVQKVLEDNLALIMRRPINLTVAGRTDAGVHATGQVAHFDIDPQALNTRSLNHDPKNLVRRLARLLPEDVRVHDASYAPGGFDARFSALRRHYVYRLSTHPRGALPTRRCDTAHWPKNIDVHAMQQAAAELVGLNDFAAFCKFREGATTIRDLQEFTWHDISTPTEPHTFEAHVSADAFCWSMVRSLVGCCLVVGEGKRPAGFAASLLAESSRSSQIPVAPARGLTLVGVDYPEDSALGERADMTRQKRVKLD
ncbi:tRNA pseudouridine(38-40) synthase TruA [Corynebacterium sp. ES2794-CONJ1]|uniref:tRNA pseudouridine(38-40) synthase TruA n=1 Tax=unclassified Corynebacterium TaxID=2624378 RepID=UPI00216AAC6B|nr:MULTISPECIES: tRNA pseudouridine(38-40) synthase TruA [unclassified Corynebacterium]MCS4489592.1 tRNA pseudouridine(38-40) synthase TruA [Corynebacterium sp. ES2775-CONJ]MCS4531502.1 tRNA pseudouridine(38-40) synthase TruA [Corynebacterium sp. ES2730-CONJ]MCU9518890.1 tRNA pseudouridine(38-40) synthase TruA [Corynebacterium sp. ES2794-CONJ1]